MEHADEAHPDRYAYHRQGGPLRHRERVHLPDGGAERHGSDREGPQDASRREDRVRVSLVEEQAGGHRENTATDSPDAQIRPQGGGRGGSHAGREFRNYRASETDEEAVTEAPEGVEVEVRVGQHARG